ncbi:MAG: hypothetical protein H0W84_13995 [Bacteroidetes bacterium]|nr:hypothetical protein [Bacteroidota bacterium]
MQKLSILILMCLTLSCTQTDHQEPVSSVTNQLFDTTIINGIYKGKNLFFQNEKLNENEFFIQKIFLNNKEVTSNINSVAFEFMLSDYKIKLEEPFQLMIVCHKTDSIRYKILNPEVIQ